MTEEVADSISEEKFRALFDNTAVGISLVSYFPGRRPTGQEKMTVCNRAMRDFFGYSQEEMLAKPIADLAHPEDMARDLAFLEELLAGRRQSYHLEKRYLRKDGRIVWGYLSASLIMDGPGNPVHVVRTVEDISLLKQAQAEAQANEERYRLLYDDAPVCYHSLDMKGYFLDVNETWLKTLGYARSEVIGRPFSDFLHPDWIPRFARNFPCFLDAGLTRDFEFDMIRKDGSPLSVCLNGRIGFNADGSFRQTHCVFLDVTEKKQMRQDLLESEERFRCLAEATFEGIFFYDDQGAVIDANGVFAEMFGYAPGEIPGLPVTELIADSVSRQRGAGMAMADSDFREVTGCRKDGACFPLEIHGKDIPYKGRLVRVAAVRDITAVKMAENTLRDINQQLEMRVSERTASLLRINQAREKEILERRKIEVDLKRNEAELQAKQIRLEEVNTALKVLLQESSAAKEQFEKRILLNIKKLLEPHLDDLQGMLTSCEQRACLDVVRQDIEKISSSFAGRLSVQNFDLTPREMLIADYIRQGRTNKDIARLLQVTPSAIDFHRRNLRRKLNIKRKNISLRSRLLTLVG
ncbi:MAG: PAS domain S-box protein [Thermodesulfobacteriota bacterium]